MRKIYVVIVQLMFSKIKLRGVSKVMVAGHIRLVKQKSFKKKGIV